MRKLTIKREKTFVGSLGVMKVYIEDASSDQLQMTVDNGEAVEQVSCRLIGEIKNGEEKSFEIQGGALRIFVIADKLSKDFCSECYQLPDGEDEISLSGKNKFNPFAGNPFRFNGNDSKIAVIGRQKGMKRGIIILIACILIGFALGYGISAAIFSALDSVERTFEEGELNITLNEGFDEAHVQGYTAVFLSDDVEIMAFENSFKSFDSSSLSAKEYATHVMDGDIELMDGITESGGLVYYTFRGVASDDTPYVYYVYTYKSSNAYWQIYFAVKESRVRWLADDVAKWAGSVSFD